MKADRKKNAVELAASKIATHALVRVVTKYGTYC